MSPPITIPKPKAIIFDWDNTLVNTWPIIHEALQYTFRTMGYPEWTLEDTKTRVHRSMRDAFPELFGEQWKEAGKLYQNYFKDHHLEKLEALEKAETILQYIRKTPLFIAIVSNKKGINLRKEVQHLGWESYFDTIVGANDAEADKPNIAPIRLALQDTNFTPSPEVWMIGDSITDMETAYNANLSAIYYNPTPPCQTTFHHCPPHIHCNTQEELITLLQQYV